MCALVGVCGGDSVGCMCPGVYVEVTELGCVCPGECVEVTG